MDQDFKLVEQDFSVFSEYISILKRYIYHMLTIAMVGFILSYILAINMPHMYKSTATILIDQTAMPEDIVKSMVTNYAEQRIQIINKKIMSSENLKNIINKFNLYQKGRETRTIHSIVDEMRENTHMKMMQGEQIIDPRSGKPLLPTVGFKLSFDSQSPEIAQQVTHEFVSLYLDQNLKSRTQIIEGATTFLGQETSRLRDEISVLEEKLAEFKEKNAANLPGLSQINLNRIDRIETRLRDANEKIRSLTENEFYLRNELTHLNPYIATYTTTGERVYGADDRLIALKAKYAALSSKYSKGHPDLVKMRKEIASLQKETGGAFNRNEYQIKLNDKQTKLALLLDRYSQSHPDVKKLKLEIASLKKSLKQAVVVKSTPIQVKPNNPAYIQLQSQLMATQSELRSMQVSRRELEGKLLFYEKSLAKSPQVEREYNALIRDYENATSKYGEVKAKQMEATMASSMEKATKGNEFVLLEPPLIPERPFKPNRKAIVFLGGLASIALAIGFVMVKEMLSPLIYTSGRLALVTGMQPLAVVPYMRSKEDLWDKQKIIKIIFSIVGMLIIFTVLWYVLSIQGKIDLVKSFFQLPDTLYAKAIV